MKRPKKNKKPRHNQYSIRRHTGCGGKVVLGHEVWRCLKCKASPVPVTDEYSKRRGHNHE